VRLQKLEVFDLRVAGEFHLPGNLNSLVFRLDAVKLNARGSGDRLNTFETAEEVEMPP